MTKNSQWIQKDNVEVYGQDKKVKIVYNYFKPISLIAIKVLDTICLYEKVHSFIKQILGL